VAAALTCTTALLAACGQPKAGTALPRGEDAATYVTAKFESTLEKSSEKLDSHASLKTSVQSKFLIGGQGADATHLATQAGNPLGTLSQNHSNTDLNDRIDYLQPAGSPVEYVLLGPAYASLEPTPWVSMPAITGNFGACSTLIYLTACKMINAVVGATKKGAAVRSAKRLTDGTTVLQADITLQNFLDFRIIVADAETTAKMTPDMLQQQIHSSITFDTQAALQRIEMSAKFSSKTKSGKDVDFDIKYAFQVIGPATSADIPNPPDASQVTALTSQAAVDDFNARKDKIQVG
jgi:hypothetical protein